MRRKLISLSILLFVCGCNEITSTPSNVSLKGDIQKISYNLKGRIINQEPKFGLKKFKTKAILTQQSISVLNSSNQVVWTGTADDAGNFLINVSVTPSTTQVYVLEGFRNFDGKRISLRTFIKFDGLKWHSIKQGEILVDDTSTAICILSEYNPTVLTPANAIDSVTSSGYVSGISSLVSAIDNLKSLVNSVLSRGKDPVAEIVVKNLSNNQFMINQNSNYDNLTKENNCSGCDLRDSDLSKVDLAGKDLSYADLRGQNLSSKNLSETILIGADLRGATLPNDLSYLDLTNVNLSGQDLRNKAMTGLILTGSDLSNSNLSGTQGNLLDLTKIRLNNVKLDNALVKYAKLERVNLFQSKFIGTNILGSSFKNADMETADLSQVADITAMNDSSDRPDFTGANLQAANMKKLNLLGKINQAKLNGANLEETTLSSIALPLDLSNPNQLTDLSRKNISDIKFSGADLTGADFRGVRFTNCDFSGIPQSGNTYKRTKLVSVNISNTDLRNMDFSRANFTNAVIVGSNFTGSKLINVIFSGTTSFLKNNFSGTDLRETYLRPTVTECTFTGANMSGMDLTKSISTTGTVQNTRVTFNFSKFGRVNFNNTIFAPSSGASTSNTVRFFTCYLKNQTFVNLSPANEKYYYYNTQDISKSITGASSSKSMRYVSFDFSDWGSNDENNTDATYFNNVDRTGAIKPNGTICGNAECTN